jgi:UPF0755 protein
MMKRPVDRADKAFLVIGLISFVLLVIFLNTRTPALPDEEWMEIQIPAGSSYRQCMAILKEKGIIKNDSILLLLGKLNNIDTRIRAGYYNLSTAMSPWEIFSRLKNGRIVEHTITMPEGSDLKQLKTKLVDAGLVDEDTWNLVYDRSFLSSLAVHAPSLEGYLYPDTYRFEKGAAPEDIFRIMVNRMRQKFDADLRKRAEELGMSENEVLTLASIIEREAFLDSERALISSVYHNRLRKKMRLQADPTVHYGTRRAGYRIRSKDLTEKTEYNTYVIQGLPPGPIASPGIKSIRAALYPADTDYLFFVSRNDGTHHFSKTGEEHLEAVALYQLQGNENINPKKQISNTR